MPEWVTIKETLTDPILNISPFHSTEPRVYTLTIESYDNNSTVKSILKVDSITITVRAIPTPVQSDVKCHVSATKAQLVDKYLLNNPIEIEIDTSHAKY